MYNPEKEKERIELEELITQEIKADGDPDYQQYVTIQNRGR
jgi:hypothetical protein